ncbi:hypothetical protein C0993_008098 [Termitomyces sp. T159_Od127]|nr:hypothetical protein C0993_008098 [Termitomyces sp. T159_Od127]
MNGPKASNAVQINDKLFRSYARKLESDNLETYTLFSERLAKWLADERAYYPESRPQILKLLKVAQTTLRRNVNADLDLKAPFHVSSYIQHPMVVPYSTLLKAISPHTDRFIEPELHDEVKALLETVTSSVPPTHIDLTSDPIEPAPGMQPNLSYIASVFQSPSFLVQSSSTASAPSHSQPPSAAVQTNANSTAVVGAFTGVSCEASDLKVREACPGNPLKGDLSACAVLSTTLTPSAEDSQASHTPIVTPFVASSPATPCSVPRFSSTSSEVISKVKKKKKAGFGLESLIQTDIEDLQKRGLVGVNIKVEPTDATISTLPYKQQVSRINQEVIVLDDDETVDPPSEIAPPPSSPYTVQSVEQTGILETTSDGAMTVVDHVLPHKSEQTISHINGDSPMDMAVGQAPQLNGHHADNIDVDIMDGPSGTLSVMRDRNPTSQRISPLVHGWPPSQGLDENGSSLTSPTKGPNLHAAADLGKDTEIEPKWNSPVPDTTTKPKDYRSPENDIVSRNVTPDSSFSPPGFHPATNDTGHIPLVTEQPGSAPLSPKTSNLQSLPNTSSSAPSIVLPSEHNFPPPSLRNSSLTSSIAPGATGDDDPLPTSSEGEKTLAVIFPYSLVTAC